MTIQSKITAAVFAACTALASCSTTVGEVRVHESFTPDAVLERVVVVGGVASSLETLDGEQRRTFEGQLHHQLTDERGDLRVAPPSTLEDALGTERLEELLDRYGDSGRLSAKDLVDVAAAVPLDAYVVFALVQEDDTEYERREEEIEGAKRDVEAIYTSIRKVAVDLRVYDATQRSFVWSGVVGAKKQARNSEVERPDWEWLTMLDFLFGASKSDKHPDPPSLVSVMPSAFERFARELP